MRPDAGACPDLDAGLDHGVGTDLDAFRELGL
jgi:hypothetical protein